MLWLVEIRFLLFNYTLEKAVGLHIYIYTNYNYIYYNITIQLHIYKLFHPKNISHNDELSNVITQTVVSFFFFMMYASVHPFPDLAAVWPCVGKLIDLQAIQGLV